MATGNEQDDRIRAQGDYREGDQYTVTGGGVAAPEIHAHIVVGRDQVIHQAPPRPVSLTAPAPPSHFTGRADSIAEIAATLRAGETIALVGTFGIGKTALAKKLAETLVDAFPGGVLWTEMGRSPEELSLILGRWACLCGREIKDLSDVAGLAGLVRGLLSERERLLVILDNVWTDEPARALMEARPPDAALLLTTRDGALARRLRCRVRDLERLSDDEGVALLGKLLGGLDGQDVAAMGIVRSLGGHPQALELAAGQLDGPADLPGLRARLRERPSLAYLKLGEGRQDDVEASLALSYDGLDEALRRRFRALGVFAEDAWFDAVAAAAVWGDADEETARAALWTLARRAMVGRAVDGDGAPDRYRQHPLLRLYARSLLTAAGELGEAADRHAAHYLDLADRDPEDWRAIEEAWPQVQAGWAHVRVAGDERTLDYVRAVLKFLRLRGPLADALAWALQAREVAEAFGRQGDVRALLNDIGYIYWQQGELRRALEHFQRVLPLSEQVGDRYGEAITRNNIGYIYWQQGELRRALCY